MFARDFIGDPAAAGHAETTDLTTQDTKVHEGFETRVLLRVLCPEPLSEDIFDLAQQSAALRPVLNVNASFQLLE
jgi:hypothetical protein